MPEPIILVVEDDQIQKKQILRCLKAEGYRTASASSGEEALEILGKQEIRLILTDRKMPGMDGDALLKRVRTHYMAIPVAIITAFPEGVEELAPDGLLVKPYSAEQLLMLVRKILGKPDA